MLREFKIVGAASGKVAVPDFEEHGAAPDQRTWFQLDDQRSAA
jgi:hypothetical protein